MTPYTLDQKENGSKLGKNRNPLLITHIFRQQKSYNPETRKNIQLSVILIFLPGRPLTPLDSLPSGLF